MKRSKNATGALFKITLAIVLTVTSITPIYANGGATSGDNFILRKGSKKEPVERKLEDPGGDVELFNQLMKDIYGKKESGTWNNEGIPVKKPTTSTGQIMMPVKKGRVSSQFGVRSMGGTDYHKGIDISRNGGEDIVLPMDCKILGSKVGYNLGAGNYVKASSVENPDIIFTFMHMDGTPMINGKAVSKLVGSTFPAGTKIGVVGNTGASTGPHLHFQVVYAKQAMSGGVASKFKGAIPPIHALFGDNAMNEFKKYITLGQSNNRKENKLMIWNGKTVEQLEMK